MRRGGASWLTAKLPPQVPLCFCLSFHLCARHWNTCNFHHAAARADELTSCEKGLEHTHAHTLTDTLSLLHVYLSYLFRGLCPLSYAVKCRFTYCLSFFFVCLRVTPLTHSLSLTHMQAHTHTQRQNGCLSLLLLPALVSVKLLQQWREAWQHWATEGISLFKDIKMVCSPSLLNHRHLDSSVCVCVCMHACACVWTERRKEPPAAFLHCERLSVSLLSNIPGLQWKTLHSTSFLLLLFLLPLLLLLSSCSLTLDSWHFLVNLLETFKFTWCLALFFLLHLLLLLLFLLCGAATPLHMDRRRASVYTSGRSFPSPPSCSSVCQ